MIRSLKRFYERNKLYLVYAHLVIVFALIYLSFLFGPLLKYLLPAIIISVVKILFDTLHGLENQITSTLNPEYYPSITDAADKLKSIVRNDKETTVEVLAGSGGATVQIILPTIIAATKDTTKVTLTVHLIDPGSPMLPRCPRHWATEVRESIEILKVRYQDSRYHLRIYTYDYLPIISGVLVNEKHLFIGAFRWKKIGDYYDLTSSDQAHRYVVGQRGTNRPFYELFRNWTGENPCRRLHFSNNPQHLPTPQPTGTGAQVSA